MPKEYKIKNCPLCNSKAKLEINKGGGHAPNRPPWYRERVHCVKNSCGTTTKTCNYPGGAVKIWNRRDEYDELFKLIEKYFHSCNDIHDPNVTCELQDYYLKNKPHYKDGGIV
jgi:hypothetical protein